MMKTTFDLSIGHILDTFSARILNRSVEDCGYVELCFTNSLRTLKVLS